MLAATLLLAAMAITPTDQTVQVAKGTKLDVNNFAGDVNIKVWDKDAVRVEALRDHLGLNRRALGRGQVRGQERDRHMQPFVPLGYLQ